MGSLSPEKLKYMLIEITQQKQEKSLTEILIHSSLTFQTIWSRNLLVTDINIELLTKPSIFTKYFDDKRTFETLIRTRARSLTPSSYSVIDVKITPDYSKLQLVDSLVLQVHTDWEEINGFQQKLIENLKVCNHSTDFQNIGNTARTTMDKLARLVYDPVKHKPSEPTIKVNDGMFKNQLHSYIKAELSGEKNREFRKVAESAVEFVKSSVDIMNSTTHSLNAEKHLAEVCVISTISAISIINLIEKLKISYYPNR